MCLAAPSRVTKLLEGGFLAEVESFGSKRQVGILMVPEVKVGDYVLIHAGFAIQILDEEEANERIQVWEEILCSEKS